MSIIFDHAVKYGGKYYPPNTPINEPVKGKQEAEPEIDPAAKQEVDKKNARKRGKGDS